MARDDRPLMRALRGEALPVPPIWLMRQAGRYLPEYRAIRAKAGSFLDLCYTPELAAEVTLQPVRRFGLDAAILFADILLVPHALGCALSFVEGEGPRLSTVTSAGDLARLRPVEAVHATLAPVYETVRLVRASLPPTVPLIGFAGAPWTVATYMTAGRGTPGQQPARELLYRDPRTFDALIERLTEATIAYLLAQVAAGAEVVKLFDSWAGALPGPLFARYAIEPARRIAAAVRAAHPDVPVIGFPRGAGAGYAGFAAAAGVQAVALDTGVDPAWAARELQPRLCVQGNLDPLLLVVGGPALRDAARRMVDGFSGGPYVFNLGHGLTPDADPALVETLVRTIRG
ncbi:MAG: uroporphyrinogen decarboxylase [Amaricoccus sp.]